MKHHIMKGHEFFRDFPFWINRHYHHYVDGIEMHGHDFIELVYVVHGEGQHIFEGEPYDIRAGDVFIINPGEVHTYSIQPGKEIEIINCLFLPSLIQDSLLRELEISHSMDYFYVHPFLNKYERFHHRLNLSGKEADRVLSLLESMMLEFGGYQSGYSTLIKLQMVELLILLSRFYGLVLHEKTVELSHSREMFVRRICGFLERHYNEKITLESLAELYSISIRQLNRLFKQESGGSVIDMVHQIRIERAKHLLTETDDKIIDVATGIGYEDSSFFSKLFQRRVGCSPGKFREQARNRNKNT